MENCVELMVGVAENGGKRRFGVMEDDGMWKET